MSENKKEILAVLEKFRQGMRSGSFDEHIFSPEVETNCYHTGKGIGIRETVKLLSYPGPDPQYVKQNVENVITRWKGVRAQQSFHIQQLFALYSENDEFHYVQYGGTFVLSYIYTEQGWKISKILFDLCWLDGNSYWVKGWKMIDFRMPKQHKQVIDWKVDGALRVIPQNEDELSDDEQIRECMFNYGWVIDAEDYGLFCQIATDDVVIEDGYHGKVFQGNRTWTDFLRLLNQKEPCLHHTYQIESVDITGDEAIGKMSRLEPNRIGSKRINGDNYYMDWLTLDYAINLKKINNIWKISNVRFVKNIRGVPVYEN